MKRCKHCGKRIFRGDGGKYDLVIWVHYGYANRTCAPPLVAKYAEPREEA